MIVRRREVKDIMATLITVIGLLVFSPGVFSTKLYISLDGKDADDCGPFASPCKSIKHAVTQRSSSGDVIMVDGKNGNAKAKFYDLKIPIIHTLAIEGFNGRPIIVCRHPTHLFMLRNTTVYFRNLAFEYEETKPSASSAIYVESSSVFIKRCHFQNVPQALESFCMRATSCVHNISDSNFIHPHQGIALRGILGSYTVTLVRNNFIGRPGYSTRALNVTDQKSGQRLSFNWSIIVDSCQFSYFRNAMYCSSANSLQVRITNSHFRHNHETVESMQGLSAVLPGAAIYYSSYRVTSYSTHSELTIDDSVFANNSNDVGTAGAIYLNSVHEVPATIQNCTFIGNIATSDGGAIHAEGFIKLNLITSTFRDNVCSCGISKECSKGRINAAPIGLGGAINLATTLNKHTIRSFRFQFIQYCKFENNTAEVSGGAIYSTDGLFITSTYFESPRIPSKTPFEAVVIAGSGYSLFFNVTVRVLNASSTQSAVLFRNGFSNAINIYDNSNFICPIGSILSTRGFRSKNSNPGMPFVALRLFSFYCQACQPDYYTLNYSILRNRTITGMKCSRCPAGGVCRSGIIRAKDNHWGHGGETKENITFVQLPRDYGCSSKECVTYNSCAKHRQGDLCGTCVPGYSESVFSSKCVPNENCRRIRIWLVGALVLTVYLIFFLYKKEIINFIKSQLMMVLQSLKSVIKEEHDNQLTITVDPYGHSIQHSKREDKINQIEDSNEETCTIRESCAQGISQLGLVSNHGNNKGSCIAREDQRRNASQSNVNRNVVVEQNEAAEHLTIITNNDAIEDEERANHSPGIDCSQGRQDVEIQREQLATEDSDIFTGFRKIIFYFYQIENILRAYHSDTGSHIFQLVRQAVSGIFNFEFSTGEGGSFSCALFDVTPIWKVILRLSFVATVLTVLIVIFVIAKVYNYLRDKFRKETIYQQMAKTGKTNFRVRVLLVLFEMVLLSYAAVTKALFALLTCVKVGNKQLLLIQGEIQCYGSWQYGLVCVGLCWVIPFCLFVTFLPGLLQDKKIGQTGVFLGCAFPLPGLIYAFCQKKNGEQERPEHNQSKENDVTNGVLKFLVGPFKSSSKHQSRWEGVYLARRLILVSVNAFDQDQMYKLYAMLLIQVLFLSHHQHVKPFKSKSLNVLETISLIAQIMITAVNTFAAYDYMHGFHEEGADLYLLKIFAWAELVLVLLAPVLISVVVTLLIIANIVIMVCKIFKWICHKI